MVFEELLYLRDVRGIIPIIAHIERYRKSRKYKALIEFVKQNNILCQVNATSFFSKDYTKTLNKLFTLDCVTFIATDSHSMQKRPPILKRALEKIAAEYGDEVSEKLIHNADKLYLTIVNKEHGNDF
jgi:protein-tyrosine phosphatase